MPTGDHRTGGTFPFGALFPLQPVAAPGDTSDIERRLADVEERARREDRDREARSPAPAGLNRPGGSLDVLLDELPAPLVPDVDAGGSDEQEPARPRRAGAGSDQ